jgi:uncharacterized protein YcaQ
MNEDRYVEVALLREVMLQHISAQPQRAAQIFAGVRAAWGTCGGRRLWRALQWLIAAGKVQRAGRRCAGALYAKIPPCIEKATV